MLFEFQSFVEDLLENPEKKAVAENYLKAFGDNMRNKDTCEQPFYKEYLSKFKPHSYKVCKECDDEFDWDLLLKLVAGSFSSEYKFSHELDGSLPEFYITVSTNKQNITKRISELWSFQVLRLYEIYVEECMNLSSLMKNEEKERIPIEAERKLRLKRWENELIRLKKLDEISQFL